jgi:GntR family transcriptional repressor for pyruvate dehydrogenase complex
MSGRDHGQTASAHPSLPDGILAPMSDTAVAPHPFPVRKVKKAYEQVAEHLQELVYRGVLTSGDKLPSETAMATQYGVSRATVREALRLLAAQNLIRTGKGAHGGSFVTLPSVDHISEFLNANINLLTASRDVTLEEFLEARELLEVPAARLAAERHNESELIEVENSIPEEPVTLNTEQLFAYNKGFHSAVVEASRNTLIVIAAQPIFSVLQTNLARSTLSQEFHRTINQHHHEIADAIGHGDGDAAADLMRSHLQYLRPFYEGAWKHAKKDLTP